MSMKILIVDDREYQRKILKSILVEHEIFEASCVLSAIESANKNNPDIIIMETIMPAGGGYGALKILKSNDQTKNIPVIMTSGKNMNFDIYYSQQLGAAKLLPKPFTKDNVLEVLKFASVPYLKHCLEKELNSINQTDPTRIKI